MEVTAMMLRPTEKVICTISNSVQLSVRPSGSLRFIARLTFTLSLEREREREREREERECVCGREGKREKREKRERERS
jgi:hypothetical protein